ncbi:MAG: hypothetical protein HY040_20510 [Planctomycetes bacterium]|nr:hypothetical protein [Planctomycetota bacterium]
MWVKKNSASATNEDELIAAIITPLEGHSDEEVKEMLTRLDAEVRLLADGSFSVKAPRRTLNAVSAIAHVEPKGLRPLQ